MLLVCLRPRLLIPVLHGHDLLLVVDPNGCDEVGGEFLVRVLHDDARLADRRVADRCLWRWWEGDESEREIGERERAEENSLDAAPYLPHTQHRDTWICPCPPWH